MDNPGSSQSQFVGSSINEGQLPNPIPRLEEPIRFSGDTSMSGTPDVSADIREHLHITETSSEEDDEGDDTTSDTNSSVEESEGLEARVRGLRLAELPTGICYDERMRYHAEVSATTGENVHPEDPRRIYYIYKELHEAGLVADPRFKKSDLIVKTPLHPIVAREATRDECIMVHTEAHYDFVKHTAELSDEELIDLSEDIHMDSIYFNSLSYFSAKLSAGAAIDTCRAVVEGKEVKNAIAVIRPPGHHAEVQSTMGFCLFNNVCIASKVCQKDYGPTCRKILILDWDVHHGNGCQKAFYQDPNILYISIHVHMNGGFYPSGQDGAMGKVGEGAGEGKNVNIPWPTKGMGDGDYMYAFQHVVMPIAQEFDPDLVIVAAGFDAAAGDELGGCFVSPACYAHMTHMLMALANGKVAVCLEGGYNFIAISKSALAVTRTLMGEPPDRLIATQATDVAIETVQQVRQIQSRYWRCIVPKDPEGEKPKGEPLHDLLRELHVTRFYEKFKMTELHILRDTISTSFHGQVLASREYWNQKYLLVVFHDSPEILTPGGQTTTLQRSHETLVLDGTKEYITDALSHGFGVIDVNIPELITLPYSLVSTLSLEEAARARSHYDHDTDALQVPYAGTLDLARQDGAKLAKYLWENYIQPYGFAPESIILMGCGFAFHAVARLMSELPGEAVYQSPMYERDNSNPLAGTTTGTLAGVVGFIATTPVRPVSNQGNPWVSEWYKKNSLVFVSERHAIFKKEGKTSRKYGDLVRVRETVLSEIMMSEEVKGVAWRFMLGRVRAGREESTDDDVEEVEVRVERGNGGARDRGVDEGDVGDGGVKIEAGDGTTIVAREFEDGEGTTLSVEDVVMSTEK